MGGFRRNSVIEMQDDTDQRAYFIGDTSSYGTQCVTIPRFHTLRHGNHIFCEVKPYFVSIMAFGSAPAALPQSAHNTPFTKLKSEMIKYQ